MSRKTFVYATHDIPLECDVYANGDEPQGNPVVLFFHAGGLVGGARTCIPPWLVQACVQRQWPLLSASYRLAPQVDGAGLLQDARAAYHFAQEWAGPPTRRVLVAGASAGFSLAALVAHHVVDPPPVALLSITGIPTFQHPFFSSSTLIPPEPFTKEQLQKYMDETVSVGVQPEADGMVFSPAMITSAGAKELEYVRPKPSSETVSEDGISRGCLYDYFLYENLFPSLVGAVDPGFTWATQDSGREKLKRWPITVFIQGDADTDVDMAVTVHAAECLGPDKARLCLAKDQPHLFEATRFIEDEGDAMDAVRSAVHELDLIVSRMSA